MTPAECTADLRLHALRAALWIQLHDAQLAGETQAVEVLYALYALVVHDESLSASQLKERIGEFLAPLSWAAQHEILKRIRAAWPELRTA